MYSQRRIKWPTLFFITLSLLLGGCGDSALQYPESKRVAQVDDYHGTQVEDPYRWLEELDSEDTKSWVAAQNAVSGSYLAKLRKRDAIKERLTELWDFERYDIPFKAGGKYFYRRNDGLQNQSVLYVASSIDGEARVLIDPNTFREDATISLRQPKVSPNGEYIAYGLSDGGSDWTNWKIRNVETGEDLQDELRFTKFIEVSWAPNSKGFYYSRYPEGTNGKGDDSQAVSIYFHSLGEAQSEDRKVYAIPDQPRHNPYGTVTDDGRYLVVDVHEGFTTNAVHYLNLRGTNGKAVPLFDKWDALYTFLGNNGREFYFSTNKDAPLGRVIAVNIGRPDISNWRDVIPEGAEALDEATYVGGVFIGRYLKDARTVVEIFDRKGKSLRTVDLPASGTANGFKGQPDEAETFYSFTNQITPTSIYRYNLITGESSLFAKSEVQGIDLDEYESKQVFYNSKDGTRVPMSITHRKGIELDGQNPTLLYAYGGFNISLTPSFNVARLVWMEMGGVLAIPNLRGGGEYGEAWHLAGTKANKQNVFDDFIAAAEWLIENNYTSSPKLAIQGGSNGGLLVGACITQRPELYGAALPAVGVLDMLRYHTPSANARSWSSDYGLSENESDFKALFAYSPLHNVKPETCYPPTLITTADHDDRVVPWHSFKFGAAMQHAQSCDHPVILRVETRAGHGAGTPTWMRIENIADQWAFLAENLGVN